MADGIKDYLQAYRADPKGKYGGKDRMETLPTEFDKYNINKLLRGLKAGEKYGVPQLTKQQLANLALHEGREDFGYNQINSDNKRAMEIRQKLIKEGIPHSAAGFAGAVFDKMDVAKRLNIPFEYAWNGTGTSQLGRTGKDYVNEAKAMQYAATHPKNMELMDFIDRSLQGKLTPEEKIVNEIRTLEDYGIMYGDVGKAQFVKNIQKSVSPEAQKLANAIDPAYLEAIISNQLRAQYGITPLSDKNILERVNLNLGTMEPEWKQKRYNVYALTNMAATHPEIKPFIDKAVLEISNQIKKAVPEYGAKNITMPDDYRVGGRVKLI